jgi:hypothetical protein
MEFTFEEKFIFGNQNFIKCYFDVKSGGPAKSGCLIADRRGVLYSPMISDSNKIYMHRLKLIDVRNKNLVIRCIHLVQHNKRSYVFLACESIEGDAYCLITYCVSNLEICDGENELFPWQILDIPFKIMDLQSLTDATGNSVIVICGSDKRLHIYSLDVQCTIRPKKKSNFLRDKVIEQLLISAEYPETFLASALPLRLYLCQDSINQSIYDALLGYSNGIVVWLHTTPYLSAPENEHEIIQEIPLYHGSSIKPIRKATSELSTKPGLSILRRNLSAGDLAKSGELDFDSLAFDDSNSIASRHTESSTLEKPAAQQQQNHPQSEPSIPPLKADVIENKTILFDGIVSCLCFYQVPLPIDPTATATVENKNKSLQWFAPKPKKQQSLPCVVFGLAGGGTLLACFEDSERPIAILPGSHKRGGVLALALGNISSNICQDIVSNRQHVFYSHILFDTIFCPLYPVICDLYPTLIRIRTSLRLL